MDQLQDEARASRLAERLTVAEVPCEEGGREEGREGGREGGRKGGREEGREGGREGGWEGISKGREGGKEGITESKIMNVKIRVVPKRVVTSTCVVALDAVFYEHAAFPRLLFTEKEGSCDQHIAGSMTTLL